MANWITEESERRRKAREIAGSLTAIRLRGDTSKRETERERERGGEGDKAITTCVESAVRLSSRLISNVELQRGMRGRLVFPVARRIWGKIDNSRGVFRLRGRDISPLIGSSFDGGERVETADYFLRDQSDATLSSRQHPIGTLAGLMVIPTPGVAETSSLFRN